MMIEKIRGLMGRLHRDDTGDVPVGTIVLIGLVVIPLILMLVLFGDKVLEWLYKQWELVTTNSGVSKAPG